ncbi:MAG: hypothetical protein LBU77_06300 [Clostridiales bacterium]|jgi:hypothetical protein|nr:hypothetical protein [Clostridiales bacterium]
MNTPKKYRRKPIRTTPSRGGPDLCVLSELEHTILHSPNPEELYKLFPKKKSRIKKAH